MKAFSVVACVLGGLIAAGACAAPIESDRTSIRVRYDHRKLTSAAAARRLLRRIDNAALESCGASPFSLDEVKTAAMASRCWKDAVADAVRRLHDPLLSAVQIREARAPSIASAIAP